MQKKEIVIRYEEYGDNEKLSSEDFGLLNEAHVALTGSYAPYSEFHVGAAVLLDNGHIIRGSNQENAAFPSGLCAERVALFHAKSEFPEATIKSLAITASSDNFSTNQPITPCGSCRQVIAETEKRQNSSIKIVMKGQTGVTRIVTGVESLLPMMFHEKQLRKNK
jgi:cytidine deaminase